MKYSKEKTDTLIKALKLGVSIKSACACAGISSTTYYEWLKQHDEFRIAIDSTQYHVERKALRELRKLAKDNWRVWAWLLERRYPDQWSIKSEQKIEMHTPCNEGQTTVINLLQKITEDSRTN